MKTPFVTLLLMAVTTALSADTVRYTYDASGNCVKREIVVQSRAAENEAVTPMSSLPFEKALSVHPNPTTGLMTLNIAGYSETDRCEIHLYNLTGQRVLSNTDISSPAVQLDITAQPAGIYIMSIVLNGSKSSLKVIKK